MPSQSAIRSTIPDVPAPFAGAAFPIGSRAKERWQPAPQRAGRSDA